jgi:hypothetical protein
LALIDQSNGGEKYKSHAYEFDLHTHEKNFATGNSTSDFSSLCYVIGLDQSIAQSLFVNPILLTGFLRAAWYSIKE